MLMEKTEFFTPDSETEILARKHGLIYFYHNLHHVVTVCDEEENAIICQKFFGIKKMHALSWVEAH